MDTLGRLRISLNLAIALGIFAIAIILVSNPSIFAPAKGAINWDDLPDPTKRDIHSRYVSSSPSSPPSTNTNPPSRSISSIYDPSCSITKGEGISNAAMPAYMTSNNIVPTSQVQIENGFYDFQIILEDKLLQSNNLLSYVRGSNHPEIINGQVIDTHYPDYLYSPANAELGSSRYSPASSPSILDSFQNIKLRDSGVPEVGYGVETVFNDVLFSPMTNDKAPGGQAQFQNIIMRHGGVVQANNLLRVNSIPQYPMIFDYDNQDQPHSYSPVELILVSVMGESPLLLHGALRDITTPAEYLPGYKQVNFATFDEDSNNLSTGVGNEGNHIAPISYSKEPSRLYAPPFHLTENNGGSNILGQISHDPLLLDDGSAYATGNNPYGQISQNEEAQFQDNLKNAIIHHDI